MEIIERYFGDFTPKQQKQFAQLKPLYHQWNEQINVISRKDIDTLYERHILHSLAIAALVSFAPSARIIDIGTGGGFPGVPLAIFFPECSFTLVDSIGKKIKVVNAVAEALELKNISTFHCRVENLPEQQFDYAVSRAVAPLADLWKWVKPFINKGRQTDDFANGLFCLKGGDLSNEIAQSGLRPHTWPINNYFEESFFDEKFIVYVPR